MEVFYLAPDAVKVKEGLARIREEYGDIDELAISIKTNGQIQPIVLTQANELIVGGRRLAACAKAGIEVMAIYRENVTDLQLRELELEENLRRKTLTFVEEALGIRELDRLKKDQYGEKGPGRGQSSGWSTTATANLLGKSRSSVVGNLMLADAMDIFPQVKKAKDSTEATKLLKKLEEELIVAELRKRQKERPQAELTSATTHYQVGDVITGIQKLPSSIADFLEIDTPYGIDLVTKRKSYTADVDLRAMSRYTEWTLEEYTSNIQLLAKETYRILKDDAWGVWWFDLEHYQLVFAALQAAGFAVDKIPAIWYKGKGSAQTQQPELYFARAYEVFFLVRKGNPVMRKRGRVNVFDFASVASQHRIHPTEKPIELLCEFLDIFAYPNAIVLCPCLGSGNTLRAAYMKGMSGVGFDLDEDLKTKFLARVAGDIEAKLYGGSGI